MSRRQASRKSFRHGLSLVGLTRLFPDDEVARGWFEAARWGGRPFCPHCGSERVQCNIAHPSQTHRCRENSCRKRFTVKVGTAMERSRLGYRTWALAIYFLTTSLEGVSGMKLHRELRITQKSAWFLAHRIREWFASDAARHNNRCAGALAQMRPAIQALERKQRTRAQPGADMKASPLAP